MIDLSDGQGEVPFPKKAMILSAGRGAWLRPFADRDPQGYGAHWW